MLAEPSPEKPATKKPVTELTEAGKKLEGRYSETLAGLRKEIAESLPQLAAGDLAALRQAAEAQAAANAAMGNLAEIETAKALVNHAKGKWIGGAERGIAAARMAIRDAKSEEERKKAEEELAKWEADKEQGLAALKERQAAYERIKTGAEKLGKASADSEKELAKARTDEEAAAKDILDRLQPFLSGGSLDGKLVKCAVLTAATPRELALYAQQGADKETLVEQLLGDAALMKEMLAAGGARRGKYGKAMEIFTSIRKASARANEGHFRSLALAVALEHAEPFNERNPKIKRKVVPVKRYLHYEKAHLDGELDPAFGDFNTWEYRMVVNCDAPDETLAWGREMLRNYRPDLVRMENRAWRYSLLVKTDVIFSDENISRDLPTQQFYQNILMNGGTCGRRAFFGRFILRSFGIPVWGVEQKGHAAAARWTPDGWVVNLGADFEWSWWHENGMPRTGADFLRETQARKQPNDWLNVLRLRWISLALGEEPRNERTAAPGGIWSALAHYENVTAARKNGAGQPTPAGKQEPKAGDPGAVTDAERKIKVKTDGTFTLPAVAFIPQEKGDPQIIPMKGFSGGTQLHLARELRQDLAFDYAFEAPESGNYMLSADVVTVHAGQELQLFVNGAEEAVPIPLPYTAGGRAQTQHVEVTLNKGRNSLLFTRPAPGEGLTIRNFTLKLVR